MRFSPTDEQRIILAPTFGGARFVYNWGLKTRSPAYQERGEKLNDYTLAPMLPDLKKQQNNPSATYASHAFKWDGKQLIRGSR